MTADQTRALPDLTARAIAVARIGIGVVATVAPRLTARLQFGSSDGAAIAAMRMLGGRDLALGVGALLAARRGPQALRGWLDAGVVADAADVLAFARIDRGSARMRPLTLMAASGAVVAGTWAARSLTDT